MPIEEVRNYLNGKIGKDTVLSDDLTRELTNGIDDIIGAAPSFPSVTLLELDSAVAEIKYDPKTNGALLSFNLKF